MAQPAWYYKLHFTCPSFSLYGLDLPPSPTYATKSFGFKFWLSHLTATSPEASYFTSPSFRALICISWMILEPCLMLVSRNRDEINYLTRCWVPSERRRQLCPHNWELLYGLPSPSLLLGLASPFFGGAAHTCPADHSRGHLSCLPLFGHR